MGRNDTTTFSEGSFDSRPPYPVEIWMKLVIACEARFRLRERDRESRDVGVCIDGSPEFVGAFAVIEGVPAFLAEEVERAIFRNVRFGLPEDRGGGPLVNVEGGIAPPSEERDRKSTRLNSS